MFARRISVERIDAAGARHACPIRQIDNFAMRNFTNDAVFDDTFPAGDGVLEIGHRVPLERLKTAMEDWFRRKGYLQADERLEVTEDREQGNKGAREQGSKKAKTEERNLQASLLRARAPLLRRGTGPRQPSTAVKNLPGKVAVPISKGGAQLRGEPSIPDSLLRGRDPRAATARQRRRSGRN